MIVGGGAVRATTFTRQEVQRPRPPHVAVTSIPCPWATRSSELPGAAATVRASGRNVMGTVASGGGEPIDSGARERRASNGARREPRRARPGVRSARRDGGDRRAAAGGSPAGVQLRDGQAVLELLEESGDAGIADVTERGRPRAAPASSWAASCQAGDPVAIEAVVVPLDETLDLHPFAPADIPEVVREYLTPAHEAGLAEVRLIHGRGRGVQRDAVRRILAGCALVTAFADARPERGGWGATPPHWPSGPPPPAAGRGRPDRSRRPKQEGHRGIGSGRSPINWRSSSRSCSPSWSRGR